MAHISFNPTTPAISITFKCNQCSNILSTEYFDVPTPDWSAETHHNSISSDYYEYECPHCGQKYNISLNNGFYGGDGEISDVEDSDLINIDEYLDYDPSWELEYVEEHVRDVVRVLDSIESLDDFSKEILHRNLYANVISVMEAFLYNTLSSEVLSKDEIKRKFVETYEPFIESKFSLSQIYSKYDSLDKIIFKELNKLLYHNLGKIKSIFKATLKIDIGDIDELSKCVDIRHDIVHRNGIDKNGNKHLIDKSKVLQLIDLVGNLISTIENQLYPTKKEVIEPHSCDMPVSETPFDDLFMSPDKGKKDVAIQSAQD